MKNIKLFVLIFTIHYSLITIHCFADKPHAPGPITGNTTVCQSSTNTYSIVAISGATSYTWIVPGSWNIISGQGTTSISTIAGAGSGDVCVMANNDCGTSNPPTCLTVTVNPLPAVAGTITGTGVGSVCAGGTGYTYTVPIITNATSYTWALPSGGSITAGSGTRAITVNYSTTATSGNVSVNGVNTCGTYTTSTVPVSVTPIVGNASAPYGLASLCKNPGTITYITFATNATSYTWSVPPAAGNISGTGTIGTVTWSPTYTYTGTTANVSVTANGCGTSSTASTIVKVFPTVGTPTAILGPTVPCYNPTNYSTSATNATSYNWSVTPGAGTISGTGTTGAVTWSSTYTGTATISVTANGCNGPSAATTLTVTVSAPVTLTIGAPYQGGVLAYVLQPGDPGYSPTVCHGLIAATSDQSTGVAWIQAPYSGTQTPSTSGIVVPTRIGCYPGCTGNCTACTSCNSGATGLIIGTGLCNTNAIMAQGATSGAAYICRNYTDGTYYDWFLPSRDELTQIGNNQIVLGLLPSTNYWTSSESNASNAYQETFCLGVGTGTVQKYNTGMRVRCIRSF